jgi:hypothetical protein
MRNYYQSSPSKKYFHLLLWMIGGISVLSPIASYLLVHFFNIIGPQTWFPLSWTGLSQHYYWQIVTYAFVHSASSNFTLSLLLSTAFNLGILAFTAEEIVGRFHHRGFLPFFFLLILMGGLGGALYFAFTKSITPLYGLTPTLFGLALTWGMLMPTLELQIVFMYRVKASQLIQTALTFCFLFILLGGHFATATAAIFCMLTTFLYAHYIWGLPNPYFNTSRWGKAPDLSFFYGNRESDEEFMERMLEKVHTKGLHSLTKEERNRMESISKRKKS